MSEGRGKMREGSGRRRGEMSHLKEWRGTVFVLCSCE